MILRLEQVPPGLQVRDDQGNVVSDAPGAPPLYPVSFRTWAARRAPEGEPSGASPHCDGPSQCGRSRRQLPTSRGVRCSQSLSEDALELLQDAKFKRKPETDQRLDNLRVRMGPRCPCPPPPSPPRAPASAGALRFCRAEEVPHGRHGARPLMPAPGTVQQRGRARRAGGAHAPGQVLALFRVQPGHCHQDRRARLPTTRP